MAEGNVDAMAGSAGKQHKPATDHTPGGQHVHPASAYPILLDQARLPCTTGRYQSIPHSSQLLLKQFRHILDIAYHHLSLINNGWSVFRCRYIVIRTTKLYDSFIWSSYQNNFIIPCNYDTFNIITLYIISNHSYEFTGYTKLVQFILSYHNFLLGFIKRMNKKS